MGKSRVIGFDAAKLEKDMMNYCVGKQNARLIAYAKDKIQQIGNRISSYGSKNHMDDTGNLLDSLCWGLSYDGKPISSGFYREQVATEASYLHGFSRVEFLEGSGRKKWKDAESARKMGADPFSQMDAGEPVWGHQRAAEFIEKAGLKSKAGQWLLFFAILAPYWGYWEKGFKKYVGKGHDSYVFLQFSVMAESYDQIKPELKPMRTTFRTYVPKYASKSLYAQAKKNLRNGN